MADTTTANAPAADPTALEKPGIGGYLSFILAIVFFSGLCETKEWWGILDFTVVNGSFGQLVSSVKDQAGELITATSSFRGKGGSGAIDGFMFALTLVPPIMFSVAMITVFEYYGAIRAAGYLLNFVLRPLMGLPGHTALALVASLQSTDAGAALTRSLKDEGRLTETEVEIFAAFQMTAGGRELPLLGRRDLYARQRRQPSGRSFFDRHVPRGDSPWEAILGQPDAPPSHPQVPA